MSRFSADTPIAEIVTQQPSTAAIFDQLGIDFCCGGGKPLSEAAGERGLDAQTLLTTLSALDAVQGDTAGAHEVLSMSSAELIDHIIGEHHARTRKQIPVVSDLLDTVVRVHGDGDASLAVMREKFGELAGELNEHMDLEESDLFPLCREVDEGGCPDVAPGLIEELTHEHRAVGEALSDLREIGGGYDQERAHCNTHRFLLQTLSELEEDLHVHIHEENNVLFPRARKALETASAK